MLQRNVRTVASSFFQNLLVTTAWRLGMECAAY